MESPNGKAPETISQKYERRYDLDWKLFIVIPIWLIVFIITLIIIFIGALSFSKTSMMEKMFEKMFTGAGKVAEGTSEGDFKIEDFDDCKMFKFFTQKMKSKA